MAEIFNEPQEPLKKVDESTGNINYIYPLTTDKQVIMEDGSRLNTFVNKRMVYLGDTGESATEVINADTLGGHNSEYFATSNKFTALENTINNKIPFKFGIDADGNYGYIKDGADTVTPFSQYPELISSAYSATNSYTYTFTQNYEKVYVLVYEGDSDNNNDNTCSTSSTGWKNLGAKITLDKATYLTNVVLLEKYYNIDIHTNVLYAYMYGFILKKENVINGETLTITTSHGANNYYLIFDAGTSKNLSLLDLIF